MEVTYQTSSLEALRASLAPHSVSQGSTGLPGTLQCLSGFHRSGGEGLRVNTDKTLLFLAVYP